MYCLLPDNFLGSMIVGIVGSNRYSAFGRTQHTCQAMNSSDGAFSINMSVHAALPLNVCMLVGILR